jgi:8-oxo-dGTP pyrophosphatase MutT (NUDIX family)
MDTTSQPSAWRSPGPDPHGRTGIVAAQQGAAASARAAGGSGVLLLAAMLPELSPHARYPPGMAGTGGRGRPGRRLRRVDETSAGGLVVADDGVTGPRAALIGRTDRRGRLLWSLPKGHIEEGETPEDTAVREVAEETGIIGEVVAPLGIIDFWFVADGRRVHKTVHHFLLRAIGGALSDADVEVTEVAWVPLDELSGRLAYADERALVERAPALLADSA